MPFQLPNRRRLHAQARPVARGCQAGHNKFETALVVCGMRALALIFAASTLWAGEYAVLTTGFRLRVERHSTDGATTTLYLPGGGYTILSSSEISVFETEDSIQPPAAPSATPPAAASPPPRSDFDLLIRQAAQRHGLHPALVSSVVAAESAFNPNAVSPKEIGRAHV